MQYASKNKTRGVVKKEKKKQMDDYLTYWHDDSSSAGGGAGRLMVRQEKFLLVFAISFQKGTLKATQAFLQQVILMPLVEEYNNFSRQQRAARCCSQQNIKVMRNDEESSS